MGLQLGLPRLPIQWCLGLLELPIVLLGHLLRHHQNHDHGDQHIVVDLVRARVLVYLVRVLVQVEVVRYGTK